VGLYLKPKKLDEALNLLNSAPYTIIAGGTDFFSEKAGNPSADTLDISDLAVLRTIDQSTNLIKIGALITWTDILGTSFPPAFDCIKQAAGQVGSLQIQNSATLVGNICNASPAADGVPCLLTLDAEIELSSSQQVRVLPLAEFILGNRKTACDKNEIVTALLVPKPRGNARSVFIKLATRRHLAISTVMVSALLETDSANKIRTARLAVGACSPVAIRLTELEEALVNQNIDDPLEETVQPIHLKVLSPISDIRATASYRQDASLILIKRALSILRGLDRDTC